MSTAKFDTLSNLAGTYTVPVATVAQGSAKAWVNFNGTGTVAIRASFNVSSITDNGTGNYTMNFINAMPDINYCPTYYLAYYFNLISGTSNRTMGGSTRTTSAFTFQTTWTSSTSGGASVEDLPDVNVAIFR